MNTPKTVPPSVGGEYLTCCRRRMLKEYFPRIQQCLETLSEEDVWWRAHDTDNSIGNLVLHLTGNVRQWIVAGLGGAPDKRDRPAEFSERSHIPKELLLKRFETALNEADSVLEKFDVSKLLEVRHIQRDDTTCLDAISHVVEHVSQHMGQIIYITKLRTGKDLKFYNL